MFSLSHALVLPAVPEEVSPTSLSFLLSFYFAHHQQKSNSLYGKLIPFYGKQQRFVSVPSQSHFARIVTNPLMFTVQSCCASILTRLIVIISVLINANDQLCTLYKYKYRFCRRVIFYFVSIIFMSNPLDIRVEHTGVQVKQ